MNSDDLPSYPTPQQATYAMPAQAQPPRRPAPPKHYAPAPPASHTPSAFPGGSAAAPPALDPAYQHAGPYQAPPGPQQYHPHPHVTAAASPHHHAHVPYQSPGYTQQPPPHQHRPAPPPQQYYAAGAPRVVSALAVSLGQALLPNAHYLPHQYQQQPQPQQQHQQPQLHQQQHHQQQPHNQQQPPHHQRQQPPQALAAPRAASYSGPQYVHPPVPTLSPPAVHLPSTPQMAGRGHAPAKKAPPSAASRSRESLEDTPKHAAKHRLEAELRATFDRVDANRSGKISQRELSAALVNFDNTGFRHSAVRLMIKLFSSPASGLASGLNFDQFVSLWKYLTAYKKLFVVADVNKSGDISFGEFQRIIEQIGYKLNVDLVLHLFQKFAVTDSHDDGSVAVGKLKFDAFIELLVYLRKLTDIFKQYDKQLTGVATIDYLDFLLEISNLT